MNALLFLGALLVASASAGSSSYGIPQPAPSGPEYGAPAYQSQTFKHVYVHTAPDDEPEVQSRTIRVPGGDKHVNIIFVKAPSSSSQQNTEVILPEQDEQKTLVYVLLKKAQSSSDVKVRQPAPTQPTKPDVYFIRYKDQPKGGYGGPPPAAPAAPSVPSSSYGLF